MMSGSMCTAGVVATGAGAGAGVSTAALCNAGDITAVFWKVKAVALRPPGGEGAPGADHVLKLAVSFRLDLPKSRKSW